MSGFWLSVVIMATLAAGIWAWIMQAERRAHSKDVELEILRLATSAMEIRNLILAADGDSRILLEHAFLVGQLAADAVAVAAQCEVPR